MFCGFGSEGDVIACVCPPKKIRWSRNPPVPQNVILLEHRVFAEVIRLKGGIRIDCGLIKGDIWT